MRTHFDFEDLPVGLELVHHYAWHGVLFLRADTGDHPWIIEHEGRRLAQLGSHGEFEQDRARILLPRCHQRIELDLVNGRAVETRVYVRGLGAGGEVVSAVTIDLGGAIGGGAMAVLEADSHRIQTVTVRCSAASHLVWLDALRIDAGGRGPDFELQLLHGATYGNNLIVYGGQTVTLGLKARRLRGSAGAVDLRVVGLPLGVIATVVASTNPQAVDEHSVLLTIPHGLTFAGPLRIEGTPSSAAVGPAMRSLVLSFTVASNFTITSPVTTLELPPCTPVRHPLRVSGVRWFSGQGPWTGTVKLEPLPVAPGLTVRIVPSEVALTTADPEADVVVEIVDHSHRPFLLVPWTLAIRGESPSHAPIRYELTVQHVASVLTGFSPPAGQTPHALLPGTEITLMGTGFCGQADAPPTVITFGNDLATAPLLHGSADGRTGTVRVPRLATTGVVTATSPWKSSQSPTAFEVRSWRNTHGFAFGNPPLTQGQYTWDDLTEAFGEDQTFLTISLDPCRGIPLFGLFISCGGPRLAFAPNPVGLITLGLARSLSACCHGMSVVAARVLRGEDGVMSGHIPAGARGTWDMGSASGPSVPVQRRIRAISGQQFSVEFIHAFLKTLVDIDDPGGAARYVAELEQSVTDTLRAGTYPLIEMRTGGWGHFVVATDILESSDPDVACSLHIYDPNGPFVPSEVKRDGEAHRNAELEHSRVDVLSTGQWRYPKANAADSKAGGTQGLDAGIMAVPPSLTPIRPTLIGGLPDMGTWVGGSAAVTQLVTGSGRRLLREDGSFDLDPGSGRAAAPWPGHSGALGAGGWLTQEPHRLTIAVGARDGGPGEVVVFGGGYMARLRTDLVPHASDEIVADRHEATLAYQTTEDPKPVELLMQTTAPDRSVRTLRLRCVVGRKGRLHMAYVAQEDVFRVSYTARQPSEAEAMVGWAGPDGLPDAADLREVVLQPRDVLTLRPTDWTSLGRSPVLVEVDHASGDVESREVLSTPPEPRPDLRLWAERDEEGHRIGMTISFHDPALWAQVVLVWAIRSGTEIVETGSETLREGIDTGSLEYTTRLELRGSGPYALAVHARGILVGPPFRQTVAYEELAFA